MDDSDAPTDAAIDKHLLTSPTGSVTSVLTTAFQEHADFKTLASLSGRDKQIELIRAAYDRVTNGASEAVLTHGISGTGKSSLVEFIRENVTSNDGGYFVSGKFDQLTTRQESFSAISAAFSDICDLIMQSSDLEDRRRDITAALGPDSQVLSRIVSNIRNITHQDDKEDKGATPSPNSNSDDFTRFKFACQRFLRAVATKEHPLLIFLDDLQWADEMSVRLIKSFLKDMESQHMLLCITYRDDEVDGKILLDLEQSSDGTCSSSSRGEDRTEAQQMPYTELEVRNLDTAELCGMLAQLLHMSSDSLGPLASLLLEKTAGNPNAVVQLLEHLKTKQLLVFSNESLSWEWNMHGIESEVSDNPTEIIAHKISLLDKDVQETLKLAAYLGHTFDANVLQVVVSHGQERTIANSDQASSVVRHLQVTTDKGLIEAKEKGLYRFAHDSNQHYLYSMVENELEQDMTHLRIGRSLVELVCDTATSLDREDGLAFLAASNMVRGAKYIDSDEERLRMMRFFLDTGRLASSKGTVVDAIGYLACAIRLLKEGDCASNYELYMELHNRYAEMQSCTGLFDDSNRTVDIVLRDAKCPEDRFRAQCTKAQTLIFEEKYTETIDFSCSVVLKELGQTFQARPSKVNVAVELLRTKIALRKVDPHDFLSMPRMEDKSSLAAIHVLSIVGPVAFLLPDKSFYLTSTLRHIRCVLKYGISPSTAGVLAGFALVQVMMGKTDEAYKLGKVAVELSYREEKLNIRALCLSITGLFINATKERFDQLTGPLLEGYQFGMKDGSDFVTAFYGLIAYLEARSHLGTPLAEHEDDLRRYCGQMKELQANRMMSYQVLMWQYVQNLRGYSEDPIKLTGDVTNEKEHLEAFIATEDTEGRFVLLFHRLRLEASFEAWTSVETTLALLGTDKKAVMAGMSTYFRWTDIAMASLAMFGKTAKKKFRKVGQKFMKAVEKASKDGVPSASPLLALIKAEWKAVVEKEDAGSLFDDAIEELVDHKFVVYETMAYQRAMHFMIKEMKARRAKHYLTAALERHRAWGSIAMVEYLEGAYSEVIKSVKPAYEVEVTQTSVRIDDEPRVMPRFGVTHKYQ